MKIFSLLLFLLPQVFAGDFSIMSPAPVAVNLKATCNDGLCSATVCIRNEHERNFVLRSAFLGPEQLKIHGVRFYLLKDYLNHDSDIYSPWLKVVEGTDFLKQNQLKRIDVESELNFPASGRQCFSVNLDDIYKFEAATEYIGFYMLKDACVYEIEKMLGCFNKMSNIVVIKK